VAQKIWLNGKLVNPQDATVSVYDHGLLYGDGVFEGIRVYNRRIFKGVTHLERLVDSGKAIRLEIPYSVSQLMDAMRQTIEANGTVDGYIRLCVTRGPGTLGLNPFTCKTPNVFIICDAISLYPREFYDKGLAIITSSVVRNHPASLSARVKSLNYLPNILAKIEAIDQGLMEAIMLNPQGYVAECTGDNIFIVRRRHGKTTIVTPPLHAGVLEGVTMDTVIELAQKAGYTVERSDLTKHDLYVAQEVFLTGTAAEVVPVTMVDHRTVGDGKPGEVTRKLSGLFHELVSKQAPED
jgi:branched-chain amino acid aminotransferase